MRSRVPEDTIKAIVGHSNSNNPDIEPGKSPEYAKPYVAPQGAHDAYQAGEYCIFEDEIWMSKNDANTWTPTSYPTYWEKYIG